MSASGEIDNNGESTATPQPFSSYQVAPFRTYRNTQEILSRLGTNEGDINKVVEELSDLIKNRESSLKNEITNYTITPYIESSDGVTFQQKYIGKIKIGDFEYVGKLVTCVIGTEEVGGETTTTITSTQIVSDNIDGLLLINGKFYNASTEAIIPLGELINGNNVVYTFNYSLTVGEVAETLAIQLEQLLIPEGYETSSAFYNTRTREFHVGNLPDDYSSNLGRSPEIKYFSCFLPLVDVLYLRAFGVDVMKNGVKTEDFIYVSSVNPIEDAGNDTAGDDGESDI